MFTRLLMLLLVVALGGVQSASAQHPRKAFDPNDPDKTRPMVSRAEREQLGLPAKTWDGVVQAEVYTTLHGLNETVERLKNTNTGEAINMLFRVQFEGTVCVQVLLKHDPKGKAGSKENRAALREVQRRVLGSLTAAEFHVRQLFEASPGLVGQVSEEGLAKLAKHPDVFGVCLDDQPLPERPPVAIGNRLPDAEPGKYDDAPAVKAKKVDAKVYQALEASERDRVYVLVVLDPKGEPLPRLTHVPGEMHQRGVERDAAVLMLQNRALSVLTADDFWLWTRLGGSPGFAGYINRQGLEKLGKHPEVTAVGLEEMESLPEIRGRGNRFRPRARRKP